MTVAEEIQFRILRRVSAVPDHSTRLKDVKRQVADVVDGGLLYRFKAMGQTVPLMVGITDKGRARFAELQARRGELPDIRPTAPIDNRPSFTPARNGKR